MICLIVLVRNLSCKSEIGWLSSFLLKLITASGLGSGSPSTFSRQWYYKMSRLHRIPPYRCIMIHNSPPMRAQRLTWCPKFRRPSSCIQVRTPSGGSRSTFTSPGHYHGSAMSVITYMISLLWKEHINSNLAALPSQFLPHPSSVSSLV